MWTLEDFYRMFGHFSTKCMKWLISAMMLLWVVASLPLHKKWNFPLRISSEDLLTFTEETLMEQCALKLQTKFCFFTILQENSQENTCARVSEFASLRAATLFKVKTPTQVLMNFAKFLRTTFITEYLRWLLL